MFTSQWESLYLAAVVHEEVIGFCDAGPSSDVSLIGGEIYAIYLLDQFKNQGIGSALWKEICHHFKKNKLTLFIAWVLEDNLSARQFYEKHGGKKIQEKMVDIGNHSYKEICYGFEMPIEKSHHTL